MKKVKFRALDALHTLMSLNSKGNPYVVTNDPVTPRAEEIPQDNHRNS
jgi:hypothetical protein